MKPILIGPPSDYPFDAAATARWLLRQHRSGGPCCVSSLEVLRLVAAHDGVMFKRDGKILSAALVRGLLERGVDPRPRY